MFSLKQIQTNKTVCDIFLNKLSELCSSGNTLQNIISHAHSICPELREYVNTNEKLFKSFKKRDKGSLGKIVEFYLFGQLPNSDPNPDLAWGADIKATHFKANKNGHFNAKERLTITNCCDTNKPDTLSEVANAVSLKNCKYYSKIQKGVLFVFEYNKDIESCFDKRMLCVFSYDLNELDDNEYSQIKNDFNFIQNQFKNGDITQKGQIYLHTCPHGSGHGSSTRAFAFTNKFITKLVSIKTEKPLTVKGRQWFIESSHFN